jgi:hypothetical protein
MYIINGHCLWVLRIWESGPGTEVLWVRVAGKNEGSEQEPTEIAETIEPEDLVLEEEEKSSHLDSDSKELISSRKTYVFLLKI